jgi:hypothetical protein
MCGGTGTRNKKGRVWYNTHYREGILAEHWPGERWDVNTLTKYLVIVLATQEATLVVYDIAVRRTRLTRFLFGMKPKTQFRAVAAQRPD